MIPSEFALKQPPAKSLCFASHPHAPFCRLKASPTCSAPRGRIVMGANSASKEQDPSITSAAYAVGKESLNPASSSESPPAWSLSSSSSRRSVLRAGVALLGVLASVQSPIECAAGEGGGGSLSSRMKSRSAEALSKPLLPASIFPGLGSSKNSRQTRMRSITSSLPRHTFPRLKHSR